MQSYMKRGFTESKKDMIVHPVNAHKSRTFLLFPLFHGEPAEGVGHWTLLVCNTKERKWTHYDSLRSRRKGGKTKPNEVASAVMNYVIEHCFKEEYKDALPVLEEDDTCARQDPGTLDCGIVLLKIVEDFFTKGHLDTFDAYFCADFRASLVQKFLQTSSNVVPVNDMPTFNLISED